ncbi:hypothetical protein ANN_00060 [Periplaneta americana]|uniref:Uncharacterized protein n=1 Tax=Periplaneta americana TaxID=6978 RepID=A0ABQ8TSH5_PERAM|nr:hypothetical protein ANN_00060 [Periplaneta americana]
MHFFMTNPNTALFTDEDTFEFRVSGLCGLGNHPTFHKFTDNILEFHIGFDLSHDRAIQTLMNKVTVGLVESDNILEFHIGFDFNNDRAIQTLMNKVTVGLVESGMSGKLIRESTDPRGLKHATRYVIDLSKESYDDEKLTQCVVEFSKAIIQEGESIFFHLSDEVPYLDYYVSDPFSTESISVTLKDNFYCSLEEKQVTAMSLLSVVRHVPDWVNGDDVKEHRRKLRMMNMLVFFENSLLHTLHASETWKISVSPMNRENDAAKDFVYNTYILVVSFTNNDLLELEIDIVKRLGSLLKTDNLNQVARYIIVIFGDAATEESLQMITNQLNNYDLNNVIVAFKDAEPGVVNFYTWHPHEPPSGSCGHLVQAVPLSKCTHGKLDEHFGQLKLRDYSNYVPMLTGCCAYLSSSCMNEPAFFTVNTSNVKRQDIGGGFKIYQMMLEYLNMAEICSVEPEYLSQIIFSVTMLSERGKFRQRIFKTFYTTRNNFFVHLAEEYPRWSAVIRVFSPTTWLSGLLALVLSVVVMKCLAVFIRARDDRGTVRCFMNMWATILGIAVDQMPIRISLRLFFLSWVIWSLCVNTVFQTYVTSYFVNPGLQHQIDTVEKLQDRKMLWLFCDLNALRITVEIYEYYNNSMLFESCEEAVHFFMSNPNTALFADEDAFEFRVSDLCGLGNHPTFYKFRDNILEFHIGFDLSSDLAIQTLINKLTVGLVESGIAGKLIQESADPKGLNQATRYVVDLSKEYVPFSLIHLQSPFFVLFMGYLLSLFVFLGEILCFFWKDIGEPPERSEMVLRLLEVRSLPGPQDVKRDIAFHESGQHGEIILSLVITCAETSGINLPYDNEELSQCVVEFSEEIIPQGENLFFSLSDDFVYQDIFVPTTFAFTDTNVTLNEISQCSLEKRNITALIPVRIVDEKSSWGNEDDVEKVSQEIRMRNVLLLYENSLLRSLHASARWKISVSPVETQSETWISFLHSAYILVVAFENNVTQLNQDFMSRLATLYRNSKVNELARYIIVVSGDVVTHEVLPVISDVTNIFEIKYVIVAFKDAETQIVSFYTWHPYEPPSGNCGHLLQAIPLASCRTGKLEGFDQLALRDYRNYIPKLSGCCARLLQFFTLEPAFITKSSSFFSEMKTRETGGGYKIYQYILDYLNVSERCNEDSEYFSELEFLTTMHSQKTWLSGFLALVLSVVFMRWLAVFKEGGDRIDTVKGLMNMWAAVLGVGVDEMPQGISLRLFFLSWVIWSLCVNTVFQTYVTSYFVDPGLQHQIDTVEELLDHKMMWLFCAYDAFERTVRMYDNYNYSIFFLSCGEAVHFFMSNPNTALFTDEDTFAFRISDLCNADDNPIFHRFKEDVMELYIGVYMSTDLILHSHVNRVVAHIVESGISGKIVRDSTDPKA